MEIPKSFTLFGETITVVFDNDLCQHQKIYGLADYSASIIYLSDQGIQGDRQTKYAPEKIEQTFFHELIHFIFQRLKYEKLAGNEQLICRVSNLLHQALTTQTF